MKQTVVIGVGNPLLADEGVGLEVVRWLAEHAGPEFPEVEFLDLGTSGMEVFHKLAGRRKAVLVDCARMGEAPGALRRFRPDQVRSRKELPGFSLHEGDLLDLVALSQRIGEGPAQVVIFGIEPQEIGPGERLSPELHARIPSYVAAILQELRDPEPAAAPPDGPGEAGDGQEPTPPDAEPQAR